MVSGQGIMPKVDFKKLLESKKAVETTAGGGGISYSIWELLKRNAVTPEYVCGNLSITKKTFFNAINNLKARKNLNIKRCLYKIDGKFYYFLDEPEVI